MYPGHGDRVGRWEGYTGYYPAPISGPIFNIFQEAEPTHGQMKAIPWIMMRFPKMGLEWVLELT